MPRFERFSLLNLRAVLKMPSASALETLCIRATLESLKVQRYLSGTLQEHTSSKYSLIGGPEWEDARECAKPAHGSSRSCRISQRLRGTRNIGSLGVFRDRLIA